MKKIFILLFIMLFGITSAQAYEVNINLITPMGTFFNTFYPSNFNPESPQQQPIFFELIITTTTASSIPDYKIHVEVTHADGQAVIDLITNDLSPSLPHNLNNRDIINNNPVDYDIEGNYDDLLSQIEDYVLSTGRLPDGDYHFQFEVRDLEDNPISAPVGVTITIQSPISISLITPGYPLGGFGPMSLMNQFPEFIWFSNLGNYTFDLYHIDESIESAQEIELLDKYHTESISNNSYIYPAGAPLLEQGEIYAWRVSAPLRSPGSTEIYTSVFYSFKINTEQGNQIDDTIILNFLNQLNTDDIIALQNFLNSGYNISNITWQGQQISVDDLMDILQQILDGELELQ